MAKSHGLIMDLLDALSRPGQAVKNTLAGNGTAAWHQLAQIPLDLVDTVLPKAWQPDDIATPDDEMSGRDLVGAPDNWWGHALGFGVDLATDPLTYVPGAWFAKGAGIAGDAAKAGLSAADKVLPGVEKTVTGGIGKAGKFVRDLTAQQRADHPELWNAIDRITGTSAGENAAGAASSLEAVKGLDARQRKAIGEAIFNLKMGPDGVPVGELLDSGTNTATGMPFGGLRERIAAHPDVLPEEVDKLTDVANKLTEIGRTQKTRKGIFDADSQANLPDEYLARQYNGLAKSPLEELMGESGPGLANALKERKNKTWEQIRDTLAANPGSTFETDVLPLMVKRAAQQGDLAKKADVGSAVWDLMRKGSIAVPEDALVSEASRLRSVAKKPPVPESGAYEDVGAMLGGEKAAPAVADPYGTSLGAGKAKASEQADVGAMLGGPRVQPADVSGDIEAANAAVAGEQTGKAVVGPSAKQAKPTASDFKPEELEAAKNSLLSKDFALSDPGTKSLVKMALAGMVKESPETAKLAMDALNGIAPRNAFWKALANSNAWFKKFASYGIVIPKAGKLFRNRINGPMQTFSNDATRGATLDMIKSIPSDLSGAVMDAIGRKGADAAGATIEDWERALANSKGSFENAVNQMATKHPVEAAFIKHGGLQGFIRGDELIAEASRPGWLQKLKNIADFPTKLNLALEDRMRLGLGKAQVEKYVAEGMPLEEAAKRAVKDSNDALFRYSANSKNSRMLKDLIPYVSWSTNAIPAELRMMMKHPWYASIVEHAMHRDAKSDPVYPFMEEQANYDLGKDDTGNRQVVNGAGFPFETLAEIPNPTAELGQFGRQIEKNVVGQASPVIKAAYGLVTGRDPNFETPFGTYDKIPVIGNAGEAGRLYNIAQSTGALAPIDTPLKLIDQMLDDRKDPATKALGMLTGANVVTVDPLRAKAQQLQEELDRNPDVSSFAHLTSKDADAQELIRELMDVQKKMKQRRKAATPSTGP